jgi:hypothetical protein
MVDFPALPIHTGEELRPINLNELAGTSCANCCTPALVGLVARICA